MLEDADELADRRCVHGMFVCPSDARSQSS